MNIGALKHKIIIQQKVSTVDNEGITQRVWTSYKTVYAAYRPLSGREFIQLSAANAENIVTFIMRYIPGLLNNMRVIYMNKIYNITAIIDLEGKHKEMHVTTTEEIQNG